MMIITKIRITADTDAIIIIVVVWVFNDIIPLLSLTLCYCLITTFSIIFRKIVTENPFAKIFHLRASETNSITLSITWISICDSAVSLRGLNSWRGRDFWHSSSFCKLCKMRPDKFIGLCEFQQCQWKNGPHILRLVPKLMYTLFGYVSPCKVELLEMLGMGGNVSGPQ